MMGKLNKQKNIQIAAMNAKGMTVEAIAKQAGIDAQTVKESLEQRERAYIELAAMGEEQVKLYIKDLQSKGKATAEIAELTGLSSKKVHEYIFGKEQADELPKKQSPRKKLSEETVSRIIELKQQGKSDAAVASELGVGNSSVYRAWTAHKKKHKPAQINKEFEEAVNEMIEQAKSNEPAPAATDTSSIKNENKTLSTNNDIIDEPKSQALNGVDFIGLFEGMLHEGYGDKAKIVKVIADKEKASVVFECEGRAYGLNFGLAF